MSWRTAAAAVLAVLSVCGTADAQSAPQIGGDLGTLGVPLPLFPATNWWNLDVSSAPKDNALTTQYLSVFMSPTRALHADMGGVVEGDEIYGIPFVVVDGTQPKVAVQFEYSDESDGVDHGTDTSFPFYPIPNEAKTQPYWIEGGPAGSQDPGGDRHMLIVDKDNNDLYELFALHWTGSQWTAGSGAFFDMDANDRRPEGWTSADAAGLAILPGLLRWDEVYGPNEIGHALRVTVNGSNGYVYPASHDAGDLGGAPPMGTRFRMKAGTVISGFSPAAQKIFRAMKKYGLIVADNGSNMYVTGTFDPRWFDNDYEAIDDINGAFGDVSASDFEVIEPGWNPPAMSVSDVQVPEGMPAAFAITRAGTGGAGSVDWSTTPGTALPGSDYVALTGTASFGIGEATKVVEIQTIADGKAERRERFTLDLTNPNPPDLVISDAQATALIIDGGAAPVFSVRDTHVIEPASGSVRAWFEVTLSNPSERSVSVDFATAPGSASAGSDYQSRTGTLVFRPGVTSRRVGVFVNADRTREDAEAFFLTLSHPIRAGLADALGEATILPRAH